MIIFLNNFFKIEELEILLANKKLAENSTALEFYYSDVNLIYILIKANFN